MASSGSYPLVGQRKENKNFLMTIIRKSLSGVKPARGVREKESAFRHEEVDCSDIAELSEDDFKNAVRLVPGETRSRGLAATFQVYKDKSGLFRWRLTKADGTILAISTTGYANRKLCKQVIFEMRSALASLPQT
jgi:uncharacterized protein YegP (UPF0339 family)